MRNVFITGASGCIGHYVVEALAAEPDLHLYLLLRNPDKLQLKINRDRITIIQGDLLQIEQQADVLKQMDYLIHLAAAWGGEEFSRAVNVTQSLALFNFLDRDRCKKILYFSTASLLDRQNQPVSVASRAGTAYIRTKYEMLMSRSQIQLRDRLLTLFPTLVFGGDDRHPYSHISGGLKNITRWIGLLRFLKVDGSFHFMHAADIATVTRHLLLATSVHNGDWVLGNPVLHVNDCIEQVCRFYNKRIYFRLPLPLRFARRVAPYFGVRLSEWDDYCIDHRHFTHKAVDPSTFQLKIAYPTVESLLKLYG
ncbi:MAG: NAD-dependent epimerase/dehydratase family protein [Synechococcus sp.]